MIHITRGRSALAASAVVVAVVVSLAGCAAPTHTHTGATKSAVATHTAPPPKSSSALPAGPFADGNCNRVIAPTTVKAALGAKQPAIATTENLGLGVVGGIGCHYLLGALGDSDSAEVRVDVAPRVIADSAEVTASVAPPSCGPGDEDIGAALCTATDVVGGWWYNLSDFTRYGQSEKAQLAAFESIAASLEKSLTAIAAPQRVQIVAPFGCDSGGPDFLGEGSADYTSDGLPPAEVLAATNLLERGDVICSASIDDADWSLTVYPGGGSDYGQCTHSGIGGGSSVSVPGVRSAFAVSGDTQQTPAICATDGSSLVVADDNDRGSDGGDADQSPWTSAELESLGATLVPMFAKARAVTSDWKASLPQASTGHAVAALVSGDCGKLFDTAALATAMHASPRVTIEVVDPLLATVGGIECDFAFPQVHSSKIFDLEAEVAPSAIADPTELTQSLASPACGADPNDEAGEAERCTETVAVAGWWYHLTLVNPAATDDTAVPLFASVSTMLDHTLSAAVAPTSVPVQKPFLCPAADVAGDPVTSSRVLTELYTLNWNDLRYSSGLDEIHAAAFLLSGATSCRIGVHTLDDWVATVYPNSTAAYSECTHGVYGKITRAPGLSLGFTFEHHGDEVCATDGASTISVEEIQDDDQHPWTTAELQSLGKLLPPIFAAAK